MSQFPNTPQILVQKEDGTVSYQPLGQRQPAPSLPTWRQIGEFIDFRHSGQTLAEAAYSTFATLTWQTA